MQAGQSFVPGFIQIFFFNDAASIEICPLSLRDALPTSARPATDCFVRAQHAPPLLCINHTGESVLQSDSEEHTSELQSPDHLVCRLLLEKKSRLARPRRTVAERSYSQDRYEATEV